MSKILFVFEGARTESCIFRSLKKVFFEDSAVIKCAFCNNIYNLYKQVNKDKDLDTFQLLKEREQNKNELSKYKRNDFGEIYLFFDYDGHDTPMHLDE
ncbi:MAG: hypothetical protein ACK5MI_00405 [Mangrovibacterium sp.]